MRQNETEKTDKKDGEHAVPCIKMKKAEFWHYSPTMHPSQSTPSVKHDQVVSSYVYNANKP
jgi:hypothetical protein